MKFKVGEKVKTLKERDRCGMPLFPVGTIGTITGIYYGSVSPYKVEVEGDYWYYSEDMLEKMEEKKMSELNLKKKMEITTLVQTEDGTLGIVFKNPFSKDGKGIYNPKKVGCFMYLSEYNDDLTAISEGNRKYDIKRIKFPNVDENYRLVERFFNGKGDMDFEPYFKWDWERKKRSIKKENIIRRGYAFTQRKISRCGRICPKR